MLTTLRPYTKVVEVGASTNVVINLKDSAGSALPSNYISVDASGGSTNDEFIVYLSSIPGLTTPLTPNAPVAADASGFCGIMGIAPGVKPVELFLDDQDRVSEITVYCDSAITAVVTYGNIHVGNPLRFNNRSKGS